MTDIEMRPVTSSNITHIGYDPAAHRLHVAFKDRGTYVYSDVNADEHQALIGAPSIGSHFHRHIKGKKPSLQK
jgi:hypothetical protein